MPNLLPDFLEGSLSKTTGQQQQQAQLWEVGPQRGTQILITL